MNDQATVAKETVETFWGPIQNCPLYLDLDGSLDPHVHVRNSKRQKDGRMEMVLAECENQHEAICAIGNSDPVVKDIETARAYREEINDHRPKDSRLTVLIAPLINDKTDPRMVLEAWDKPDGAEDFHCLKVFFSNVSNDGGHSVDDVRNLKGLLDATTGHMRHKKRPLPISFHAERKFDRDGKRLEMKDREWYCIETDIADVIRMNPEGTYIIRHVSDGRTLQKVEEWRKEGIDIHIEVCPQYCIMTHEDLFERQMFHCHHLCWPIYKNEWSRRLISSTAVLGFEWIHAANDFAMHVDDMSKEKKVKITSRGEVCGGLTILPSTSKSLVIDMFLAAGRRENLNAFISTNAMRLYGLKASGRKYRYARTTLKVPDAIHGEGPDGPIRAVPFLRGHAINWHLTPLWA